MRTLASILALGMVAGLAAGAHPAGAALPSAANSTIPKHVLMVGRLGALADTAFGAFTIVVRDAANDPLNGVQVEFRVLICEGARLSTDALQPGIATRCETHGISGGADFPAEGRMTLARR